LKKESWFVMNRISTYAVAALVVASCGFTACAQSKVSAQTRADHDATKLSKDGYAAIHDISEARLAIFNGQPSQAKMFTNEAQTAFEKAQKDDTVFTKAESDLRAPAGKTQPGSGTAASTTPTNWIPVDGSMTLSEDYVDTPEKSAGVAKANKQLKEGDHKHAMETLKLANIDVSFVSEVAPLDKTMSGIKKADQLIAAGKFYEANQALKGVEDGYRFDVSDVDAGPKGAANKTPKTASISATQKK
jgi:hypothetical protein